MKSSFISVLSISAVVAAALLPINVALSASVIAAAGMLALGFRDYSREIKPLSAELIPCTTANRSSLRLAV